MDGLKNTRDRQRIPMVESNGQMTTSFLCPLGTDEVAAILANFKLMKIII